MTSYFYRAAVDEAEQIIKTEKILADQSGGAFNADSGPYFSLVQSIPTHSWLNSVWPESDGTVVFEFTSPLPVSPESTTGKYAGLVGSGQARSLAAFVLILAVGETSEKVATIVTPQQNGLQLKAVHNLGLLSRGAQKKVAEMTAQFADGYISIA